MKDDDKQPPRELGRREFLNTLAGVGGITALATTGYNAGLITGGKETCQEIKDRLPSSIKKLPLQAGDARTVPDAMMAATEKYWDDKTPTASAIAAGGLAIYTAPLLLGNPVLDRRDFLKSSLQSSAATMVAMGAIAHGQGEQGSLAAQALEEHIQKSTNPDITQSDKDTAIQMLEEKSADLGKQKKLVGNVTRAGMLGWIAATLNTPPDKERGR